MGRSSMVNPFFRIYDPEADTVSLPFRHGVHQDMFSGVRVPIALIVAVLLAMSAATAGAGVKATPTEIFIVQPSRSAELSLQNPGDKPQEVEISFRFGYPVAFAMGHIEFLEGDTLGVAEPNATGWVRAVPGRVIVDPGESQTIRIVVSPPLGLPDGEYWSRIAIRTKTSQPLQVKGRQGGFVADLLSETVLPVHYRHGRVGSGIQIAGLRGSTDSTDLKFSFNLVRQGNASAWGRLTVKIVNGQGKTVESQIFPVVAYRTLAYENMVNVEGLPAGQYRLDVTLDNKHPNIRREYYMSFPAVSSSLMFNIP